MCDLSLGLSYRVHPSLCEREDRSAPDIDDLRGGSRHLA